MSGKYSQLPPNARAVIWCAVSTTRQAGEDRASMEEQEAWALDICRQNGWQVVDILRVNGHSRNYKDLNTLASDARAKGIDAFDRLITHLSKADFDVFICRDANRFARRASLLHYIVESIIYDCHAVIYSQHDGWINEDNMAGFAALKGYSIEKDMQWIREGLMQGKKRLFENGLTFGGSPPPSHKKLRDDRTGRITGLVVDEDMRSLYRHIGELLLEGLPWHYIAEQLYVRWGILTKQGGYYAAGTLRYMMYNPLVWGNLAMNRRFHRPGAWVFYEHYSKPESVSIQYRILEPVLCGDFGMQVQNELLRRLRLKGKAKPQDTYRFSHTCVCGVCGSNMVVVSQRATQKQKETHSKRFIPYGMRCSNRYPAQVNQEPCTNTIIYQDTLEEAWRGLFEKVLDDQPLWTYLSLPENAVSNVAQIEKELSTLESQIHSLIREQSLASDSIQGMYREQLGKLSERLSILKNSLKIETEKTRKPAITREELEHVRTATFWDSPNSIINRILKGILGDFRVVTLGDEVIGVRMVIKS